jgi:asparagine synthase (glutamine-hydrolysing)
MLYIDTKSWLPDELLIKADRMTMANSIELRVPLLDHVLLDWAASLPPKYKVKGKNQKRILRNAFQKILPPTVINRKKAGFPVPYGRWLQGDLKNRVAEVLLDTAAFPAGFIERATVENMLQNKAEPLQAREIFMLLIIAFLKNSFKN